MVKSVSNKPSLVSVVIPIRRNEDVKESISQIQLSFLPEIRVEIIVVDEGLERSIQRNIGINKARGDYLLILDSDHIVHRLLIWNAVSMMQHGYNALYIPEEIMTKGWFGRLRNWERQFYTTTPVDCVRFIRRQGCPRFDESMSGPEDSDFDRRVIGRRGITKYPLYHFDNVGIKDYFRKKAYYSKSMNNYAKKNPNDKVLDWKWRCFGVFLENGKWKQFLRHPIKAIEVLIMIFIRGVIFYANK